MADEKTKIKYPLACTMEAGVENLKRLSLNTEGGLQMDLETGQSPGGPNYNNIKEFHEIMTSGHAPMGKSSGTVKGWSIENIYACDDQALRLRLNIAATEKDFRQDCIDRYIKYVDQASRLPHLKKVNMHGAPKRWVTETQIYGQEGDYELQIEAIKQIASFAGEREIEITLENTNLNWDGIPDDIPGEAVNWNRRNRYFGESPEEWIKMGEDVNMPNLSLCLDSGHAATYAQIFSDHDKRTETMMTFLSRPDLIGHVHWNDQLLYDLRGRPDYHGLIGTASLPNEFHQKIKSLDATLLLEHFYSIEELEEELTFIDNL